MKILELRFKNLNSLYGEWVIDFTDPEYVSNGIFALTGPTGAGKSTILDAICLALYGATPRLGKITKSGNEIMSRRTGECYAEVMFESQAGRFRCHWEQRKARKKADGALQDQEHQIIDANTGKPIETKKSKVAGVIIEKTGMDFDRFTRSILLAQGGFDTFLKADVEQKSKILEQITGTEIYSEISRRVHERQRGERETLNLLQAEISGITILEPEQENEIRQELYVKQKEENDLAVNSAETGKAITWLSTINTLKNEINSLSDEAVKLQGDIEAFKPERDKLEQSRKAAVLDGSYATLTAIRKQQSEEQEALKAEDAKLPGLESSANNMAESHKSAELLANKSKEDLKTAMPLIQQVRSLDQTLAERSKTISEHEQSCQKDSAKIAADKQDMLKEQQKRIQLDKDHGLADGYLKQHARDEWLVGGLAGVEEQLNNLLLRQKELAEKETGLNKAEKALKQATKKLDKCTKQFGVRELELEEASKKLQQGKEVLSHLLGEQLLREYRTEKENLLREMAFLTRVAKLEDHRATLEEGKPCPLCGATEHPFAEGNAPVPDETEKKIELLTQLIDQAEDQEAVIKKLEEAEAAAQKALTYSEKTQVTAEHEKQVAEKILIELEEGLERLRADFASSKQAVSDKLQPLGISEIPDDVSLLIESLTGRLNAWQLQVKKKAEIEKQIAELDAEVKRLGAVIETRTVALAEKQSGLEQLKKDYAAGIDQRKTLYGDKKPDDEESRLQKAIADAEEAEKKARDLNAEMQQKLTAAKTHVEALKKRIAQREPELNKAEADFITTLAPAGFEDENQFLEARLNAEQQEALSAKAKKLGDRETDLKARQQDRETRLTTEIAKKVTDKPQEELETQFKADEASLKQLRDVMAALNHKLSENAAAKERIKEKQAIIDAQKKECHRWEKLHGLIGSADGKKYRNFAQGLTFELMVSHANRQFEKMTDRYLLIRDDEQPLELNVVDNYQAGEIRSTKNLSGGESFIVSLTLALGLSKMASRKVRVDSLFLDEGFGTLDEEALETALETLSELQQDGKLIGVISHVSALKERISTQINIIPVSGGKSVISGPGCGQSDKVL